MIRVFYSNRIEELVGALGAGLPARGDRDAMFEVPWLIVPSRAVGLYVDLELARHRGISGNIDTLSVKMAFARLCTGAVPELVVIERGHVVGELLARLSEAIVRGVTDEIVEESEEGQTPLGPLRPYLLAAGPARDAVDRRCVEVARALGTLFDDWAWERPELLAAWRAGKVSAGSRPGGGVGDGGSGTTASPLAAAERALWNALFAGDGRFARRGAAEKRRYLTLEAFLAEGLDASWRPPPAVHVFGLSHIPRGLQIALGRLGARTDLTVYALNPCREFWEDLETDRRTPASAPPAGGDRPARRARARGSDAGGSKQLTLTWSASQPRPQPEPEPQPDNPLLRLWGHAGRETTRLLNQLSDGDFDARWVNPIADETGVPEPPASLLGRLQQDLLDRAPMRQASSRLHLDADGSLLVTRAPNPRRELETIAAQIWEMVRDDARGAAGAGATPSEIVRPRLRFSDCAVLIAGAEEPYLSLARAVFKEALDLPHTIVGESLGAQSHMVDAVLTLLALPLGKLTRREVLDVLTHPNVHARFPDTDPRVWVQLCDALTIAHGADRDALADTYIDGDQFNWDQGCRRLALGRFVRGPRSGVDDPIELPAAAAAYLPAEVAEDLRPDADALTLLVRSLLADARFARSARLTLPDWMRFVRGLLAAYVIPVTPEDDAALLRILGALEQIAAQSPQDLAVSLGTAAELVSDVLGGLRESRGQILGAGVAIGTMSALRSVPFRVIFVAGLAPDRFPAADRLSPFDIETEGHSSQSNAAAQRLTPRLHDRYLFVETLLAARDKLVLSHVDRDQLTGDERDPSSVVLELLDVLEKGYLREGATRIRQPAEDRSRQPSPGDVASIVERAPLHRDEDPRIQAAFPSAAAESQARALGDHLRAVIPDAARLDPGAIVRGLSPGTRHLLRPLLRTIEPRLDAQPPPGSSAPSPRSDPPRVLELSDLRRFLECPLQGSARVFLGLRDLPDETEARETTDEPFDVPRAVERALLGEVFAASYAGVALPDAATLAAAYDAATTGRWAARAFPAGLFRADARRQHLAILEQWSAAIAATELASGGPLGRVRFGPPAPFAAQAERRGAIRLSVDTGAGRPLDVELHGVTEPQLAGGSERGSLVLATSEGPAKDRDDKDSLRAFIDYVALAASVPEGEGAPAFFAMVCRPRRDGAIVRPYLLRFASLDARRARAYLSQLAGELLTGVHSYLFPCDAVFFSKRSDLILSDRIKQIRTDPMLRKQSSSRWGPVPDPFDYPVPDQAEAQAMCDRRFGLYFSLRQPTTPERSSGPRASGRDGTRA